MHQVNKMPTHFMYIVVNYLTYLILYHFLGKLIVIHTKIPLSETKGIANKMRELSSGLCSLHMEIKDYEKVLPEEQSVIVEKYLRGET